MKKEIINLLNRNLDYLRLIPLNDINQFGNCYYTFKHIRELENKINFLNKEQIVEIEIGLKERLDSDFEYIQDYLYSKKINFSFLDDNDDKKTRKNI